MIINLVCPVLSSGCTGVILHATEAQSTTSVLVNRSVHACLHLACMVHNHPPFQKSSSYDVRFLQHMVSAVQKLLSLSRSLAPSGIPCCDTPQGSMLALAGIADSRCSREHQHHDHPVLSSGPTRFTMQTPEAQSAAPVVFTCVRFLSMPVPNHPAFHNHHYITHVPCSLWFELFKSYSRS